MKQDLRWVDGSERPFATRLHLPLDCLLSMSLLAGVWIQYSSHTDIALKSILLGACVTCQSLLTFLGDPSPHQPRLSER